MSVIGSGWFTEIYNDATAFSVRCSEKLFEAQSEFQKVEILRSPAMGRVLVLDNCFMVTEKDHFIYHEMIVHPAMAVLNEPREVLVIGGGDGGTVTELVKHPHLRSITLCEIDPMVVSSCTEFMPEIAAGLNDPRVKVVNDDGAAYVARYEAHFDLVLVDSTDPVGPGIALYRPSFYEAVRKSLRPGGVAVFQTESPLFMADVFAMTVGNLRSVFGNEACRPYLAVIPSYPGGMWSFTMCSQTRDPLRDAPSELPGYLDGRLKYYSAEIHKAALALPCFVKDLIRTGCGCCR